MNKQQIFNKKHVNNFFTSAILTLGLVYHAELLAQVDGFFAGDGSEISRIVDAKDVDAPVTNLKNHLLFLDSDKQLLSRNKTTSEVNILSADIPVRTYAVSHDGSKVAYSDYNDFVYLVDVNADVEQRQIISAGIMPPESSAGNVFSQLAFSKSDEYLLFNQIDDLNKYSLYSVSLSDLNRVNTLAATSDAVIVDAICNEEIYHYGYGRGIDKFFMQPQGESVLFHGSVPSISNAEFCPGAIYRVAINGSTSPELLVKDYPRNNNSNSMQVLNFEQMNDAGDVAIYELKTEQPGFDYQAVLKIDVIASEIMRPLVRPSNSENVDIFNLGTYTENLDTENSLIHVDQSFSGAMVSNQNVWGIRPNSSDIVVEYPFVYHYQGTSHPVLTNKYKENLTRLNKLVPAGQPDKAEFLFPLSDSAFNCFSGATFTENYISPELLAIVGEDYEFRETYIEPRCETVFGDFTFSSDGNILIFIAKPGGQTDLPHLYAYNLETKSEVVALTSLTEQEIVVNAEEFNVHRLFYTKPVNFNLNVNAAGEVLYIDADVLYAAKLDGSGKRKIADATDYALTDDTNIVLVQSAENAVSVVDIENSQIITTITSEDALLLENVEFNSADSVYVKTDTAVYEVSLAQASGLILANRQWNLVGVPELQEGGMTVAQALNSSGIDVSQFGRNIRMVNINAQNGRYTGVTSNSQLMPGKGYWFVQTTGESMAYAPRGAGALKELNHAGCASSAGCYVVDVVTSHYQQVISQPSMQAVKWADVRIEVDGVVCTPSQAHAAGYLADAFWHYGSSGYETYSSQLPPSGEAALEAYRGYWIQIFAQGMGTDMRLLVPAGDVDKVTAPTCR